MTRDYREQIEELIFNFPETDQDVGINQERRSFMSEEYNDYVIYAKNQRNNRTYKWEMLEKGNRTPLQFWQTDADDWPHLKSLALTLFSLAPSSVASENTLCKSTLTQSRRRNKLSYDDMRRLAFICINDSQFTGNRVLREVPNTTLPDFTMGDTALSPDGMMMWMI
ncbi:putative HAT dimerization domain, ribonuclease H-like superfamily [Plasmopara halstedii]